MSKLFEIPIYAVDRNTLHTKYSNAADKIKEDCKECAAETIQRCIDHETYPHRMWDYNHIVGYIQILTKRQDVIFEVYLPCEKKRYYWKSKSKVFLYNIHANGTHFFVDKKRNNSEIQGQVAAMLNDVIKCHIPKQYFVDTEAFLTLNRMIDYHSLIGKD